MLVRILVSAHWWVELGLVPPVGRAVRVPLEVARCSESLFVMDGAVFPILLVVWSEAF